MIGNAFDVNLVTKLLASMLPAVGLARREPQWEDCKSTFRTSRTSKKRKEVEA